MWPFKKNQSIDNLNPNTDKWSVLQGSADDGPMLIRINTSAQNWAQHPLLNIRVGFAVPLNQPNPGGLPDASENLVLNQLEDVISGYMSASGPAIHALSITTGTFKEFVFYMQNSDAIPGIHQTLQTEITSHDVQCMAEHDPEWDVYKSFTH